MSNETNFAFDVGQTVQQHSEREFSPDNTQEGNLTVIARFSNLQDALNDHADDYDESPLPAELFAIITGLVASAIDENWYKVEGEADGEIGYMVEDDLEAVEEESDNE